MKKKEIHALIISYNGDDEIINTVGSIYSQVDKIVIVDNGSNVVTKKNLDKLQHKEKIEIIYLDDNYGIGHAQNVGVSAAEKSHAYWVLMLDQDSICDSDMVKYLLDIAEKQDLATLGFCCPIIKYADENNSSSSYDFSYVNYAISSGCFFPMETLKKIGEQKAEYFIDSVDFEYCLRLLLGSYKMVRVNRAILNHKLGSRKSVNFLGFKFDISIHSPIRNYYIFRNHIFLFKEYWRFFPAFLIKKTIFLFILLLQIIFLEDRKIFNIKNVCNGVIDGIMNRDGKKIFSND